MQSTKNSSNFLGLSQTSQFLQNAFPGLKSILGLSRTSLVVTLNDDTLSINKFVFVTKTLKTNLQ